MDSRLRGNDEFGARLQGNDEFGARLRVNDGMRVPHRKFRYDSPL
ncbi:MAG: hypothetical protein AMXMBFR84_06950 [Candidatus Hydrogenedentota bacterium]